VQALLEPRACTNSTARRLTYGIERTGAAKKRFLAEFLEWDQASHWQTNSTLDYRRPSRFSKISENREVTMQPCI
jgi:hypothetical protein